ncbi:MAG: MerR family transcriptional regulator [Hyphomicrobiales bacterium]
MKISQLSVRSGVPLPTVKFYLREGLLPPGERRGPNQAVYGQEHLDRLALIRTLRDVGQLSLATIRSVIEAIEAEQPQHALMGRLADAIADEPTLPPTLTGGPGRQGIERGVRELLDRLGWRARPDSSAARRLADALVALRQTVSPHIDPAELVEYARLAYQLAEYEANYDAFELRPGLAGKVEQVVAGTILWENVFSMFRRMAHESIESERALGIRPERAQRPG